MISFSFRNKMSRHGLSLTETAVVLGIIALIFGAIWSAAGSVQQSMKVNKTAEQLATIAQNIRSFYRGQSQFGVTGNITSRMVTAEVFPKNMFPSGSATPKSLWGTDVTVSADASKDSFTVTIGSTIPPEVCRNLASHFAGRGREPGLNALLIDGSTVATSLSDLNNLNAATITDKTCNSFGLSFMLKGAKTSD